jgi:hypothetical protein
MPLSTPPRLTRSLLAAALAALALAGCAGFGGGRGNLQLSGDQEVPPVSTRASGSGSITVAGDGSVSGSISTRGVKATMAHIHVGAAGANGPVIVPLQQTGEGVWSVPPGARLTGEQMVRYQAGDLYVNVHSEAHKGGEIRAQLRP